MQQGRPANAGGLAALIGKDRSGDGNCYFARPSFFSRFHARMTCTLVTRLPGVKAPSPMSGSSPDSTASGLPWRCRAGALGKGGQRHCGQCHAQRQNHADEPFLHKILSFSSALQAGRFCCTQCTTFCPLWTVLGTNRPANALKRPGAPHAPAKTENRPVCGYRTVFCSIGITGMAY